MGLSFTEDEIPFTNHRVPLQKGDCLYLFSDGYSDQLGGPKENKFKSKNFINLIVSVSNLPMNEQKEIINKTMNDWKGDLKLNDDILVIGIKI